MLAEIFGQPCRPRESTKGLFLVISVLVIFYPSSLAVSLRSLFLILLIADPLQQLFSQRLIIERALEGEEGLQPRRHLLGFHNGNGLPVKHPKIGDVAVPYGSWKKTGSDSSMNPYARIALMP